MICSKHFASFAVLTVFGFLMAATPAAAQENGDPDRIRFRFGVDHGVGIGFPEIDSRPRETCTVGPCTGIRFDGIVNGLLSAHGSVRLGVQFNRHLALSFNQSVWLISDEVLPSFQLMGEWMPLDILQLGIGAGYDHGTGEGPSATLRVALNLTGRQSGARRDGLMLVFSSHATVLFHQYEIRPEEVVHAHTLGLGYDFY